MISNRGKRISGPWCLNWARALALSLTAFLFLNAAPDLTAQLPKSAASPQAKAEPAEVVDPLGRETPHSAFVGLLTYAEREDFATAARYLQPTPEQDTTDL